LENDDGGAMASKTNGCAKYNIKIGEAKITIIDTPGFGNASDDENVKKICDYVLTETGINCIVIV
jgi:hypothetical protein